MTLIYGLKLSVYKMLTHVLNILLPTLQTDASVATDSVKIVNAC